MFCSHLPCYHLNNKLIATAYFRLFKVEEKNFALKRWFFTHASMSNYTVSSLVMHARDPELLLRQPAMTKTGLKTIYWN